MSAELGGARLPSLAALAAQLSPILGEDGPLRPPAERGETTMADRVVEKVAAAAIREVELEAGTPHRSSHGRSNWARAQVSVDGHIATIGVDMSVVYPSPIRSVARVARRHVAARVTELTGLEVQQLDINVIGFIPAQTDRRRRVR